MSGRLCKAGVAAEPPPCQPEGAVVVSGGESVARTREKRQLPEQRALKTPYSGALDGNREEEEREGRGEKMGDLQRGWGGE